MESHYLKKDTHYRGGRPKSELGNDGGMYSVSLINKETALAPPLDGRDRAECREGGSE
ncbi:hypothetical protein LEMLEM_LOCUS8380 [Lemmus lemmus]